VFFLLQVRGFCTGMVGTYDPLLGTWIVRGTTTSMVFHRLGTLLERSQSHMYLIWQRVEPLVFLGTAVGLGCAAWRYYERSTSLRTYGRYMTGKMVWVVPGSRP
jgi:hypothetical protein